MSDSTILHQISQLVAEEHQLRAQVGAGEISSDEEQARLRALEVELDQCWDLLRRRRAAAQAGEDPDGVTARPATQVEGYLQ